MNVTPVRLRPRGGAAAAVGPTGRLGGGFVLQHSAVTGKQMGSFQVDCVIISGFKLVGQVQNVYICVLTYVNVCTDAVVWVRSARCRRARLTAVWLSLFVLRDK